MGIRATRIAPPRFVGAASSRVHDKRAPHETIDARPLFQAILRAFLLVVTAVCILTFLGYNPGSPLPRGVPLRPGHRTSALARSSPFSSVATPPRGLGRGNRKPAGRGRPAMELAGLEPATSWVRCSGDHSRPCACVR